MTTWKAIFPEDKHLACHEAGHDDLEGHLPGR